jgi:hypothetical protein
MKLLLCGDSFISDWAVKYPGAQGWPNLLAQHHTVTNLAQAGAGEYKVLQQVRKAELKQYDAIIISHSSPNRIYCVEHPVHSKDALHSNSDLIYADVKEHSNIADADLAARFYERYFDFDYHRDVANLCCQEILNLLGQHEYLNQFHIENHQNKHKYDCLSDMLNINQYLKKYPGKICHLSDEGNQLLFEHVNGWLKSIQQD